MPTKSTLGLPMSVFPVPGGPNNNKPFGGPRKPVKISLKQNNALYFLYEISNIYILQLLHFKRIIRNFLRYLCL